MQCAYCCLLRQQGGGLGGGEGVGRWGGVYFEGLYAGDGIEGEVQAGETGQGG